MELEHLREFTVIARLGSYSRAAEELCISQSALSKHILALERELGTPLLIRSARSIAVSPAGEQILPLAAEISSLGDQIQAAADRENQKNKTLLKLASIPVMAQYDITGALARFQRRVSGVMLEVTEREQREVMGLIRGGDYDLAFTRLGPEGREPDMEYLPFHRDHLVAVMSREHPLAGQATVTMEELKEQPLLFMDQRTGLYDLCQRLCQQAGFEPRIIYTGHRPENIAELAAEGMGVALLMKGHVDYLQTSQAVCADISPRVDSTICLMRKKAKKHTLVAQMFWKDIQRNGKA